MTPPGPRLAQSWPRVQPTCSEIALLPGCFCNESCEPILHIFCTPSLLCSSLQRLLSLPVRGRRTAWSARRCGPSCTCRAWGSQLSTPPLMHSSRLLIVCFNLPPSLGDAFALPPLPRVRKTNALRTATA
jgi:hypothetical protein